MIQELNKMLSITRQLNDLRVINRDLELKIGTAPRPIRLIDQEYKDNVQQKEKIIRKFGQLYRKLCEIEGEINRTVNEKLHVIHERFASIKKIQSCSVEDANKFSEEILLCVDFILCDVQACREYNFPLKVTYKFLESVQKKLFIWQTEVRTKLTLNNTITYVVGCWEVDYGQDVITWNTPSGVYRYEIEFLSKKLNLFKNVISHITHYRLVITVDAGTKTIVNIDNLDLIVSLFGFIDVSETLTNYDLGDVIYFRQKILENINNKKTISFYRLDERSIYLQYLLKNQDHDCKIIPVREKRAFQSSQSLAVEDAFLFSVLKGKNLYIIWESTEESRATHIFRTQPLAHETSIQKVFDYIISPLIINKREILGTSQIPYFEEEVEYIGCVKHTEMIDWKRNLEFMCL